MRGEVTLAESSRELGISRNLLARWKHLITVGSETAVAANEDVVPASAMRPAESKIRELERLIGKQAVDLEILRAARDEVEGDHASTARPGSDGATDDSHLSRARHRPSDRVS